MPRCCTSRRAWTKGAKRSRLPAGGSGAGREAMIIARRMFGGGRVMPYDDLGVYPLLHRTGATREDWRAFATRVLNPLRAYDEKHQTELVRTLQLFFDVGQNIKEAA